MEIGQTVQWREEDFEGNILTVAGYVIGNTPEGYLVERYDDGTTEHVKHSQVGAISQELNDGGCL